MTKSSEKLVEINHLKKYFKVGKGFLHAVDDVSFYINKGETLGLVGESGQRVHHLRRTFRMRQIYNGTNAHPTSGS